MIISSGSIESNVAVSGGTLTIQGGAIADGVNVNPESKTYFSYVTVESGGIASRVKLGFRGTLTLSGGTANYVSATDSACGVSVGYGGVINNLRVLHSSASAYVGIGSAGATLNNAIIRSGSLVIMNSNTVANDIILSA